MFDFKKKPFYLTDVRRQGYEVDENNPASWKYYMNMFGEYHISDRARLLELSNGQYDSIRIKVAGETQPVEVNFNKANISGANGDVATAITSQRPCTGVTANAAQWNYG